MSGLIDLSQLPTPDIIEVIDFETILAERKERLIGLYPEDKREAVRATLALESEPINKLLQENAYRETILRQRINNAALASLLAFARGKDLENRAADYGVERLLIKPADLDAFPPVEAVYEDDDSLLYRTQLSLEGLSVAGSRGAYEFHGLTASANVASISVDSPTFKAADISPALRTQLPPGTIVLVCDYDAGLPNPLPGDVSIAVLPHLTSEVPAEALVTTVQAALSAEDVRPITDRPRALLGQPTDYQVVATLELKSGPDSDVVLAAARKNLNAAIAQARTLEGELSLSAIYAALHIPGVSRVALTKPIADIVCDKRHHPNCTGITLSKVITS